MSGTGEVGKPRMLRLERLREWERNPRTIDPARMAALKQALVEDPAMLWARPLIALPDGTVVAGNMRLRAAAELGWASIPVVTVDLPPERATVWALRDNNSYGVWDEPKLAEILGELADNSVDLALAGFSDRDLNQILSHLQAPTDPDAAPPLPTEPRSRPGELYELGSHRLVCGDARDQDLLGLLIGAERVDAVWTDPPYGVDYEGKTARRLRIQNDTGAADELLARTLTAVTPFLSGHAPFYVCAPGGERNTRFRLALEQAGWRLHEDLVWAKDQFVLGRLDYHAAHEHVLYGWAPGGAGRPGRGSKNGCRWRGDNKQSSVFHVPRPRRSEEHPTMKPTRLVREMLLNSTARDDTVIDPFCGSGSTLIACEEIGRRCLAVELDPAYCDVIRQRYEEFTDGR